MTRAFHIGIAPTLALALLCCVVGCTDTRGYEDCTVSAISSLDRQLLSTEFKIARSSDGNEKGTILCLAAGGPAYCAFTRSTYGANNPSQAQNVGGASQIVYPFLNVLDGTSYVTGDAPAAQTEHVVAGSQSTDFIVEVDHNGDASNPRSWIHRVYVLKVNDHMCVWAQQSLNAPKPTKATPVKAGQYVESKFNGRLWVLSAPADYATDVARKKAVDDTLAAATAVGFP
jgi:hypothetical protein